MFGIRRRECISLLGGGAASMAARGAGAAVRPLAAGRRVHKSGR